MNSLKYILCSESEDSGQQCCYNQNNGRLKIGPPSGGSVQRYSLRKDPIKYAIFDFLPRTLCCSGNLFDNCDAFYEKRPSDDGSGYLAILPGMYVHMYAASYICNVCY